MKRALVTGGTAGIGRALCERLLRAGWQVESLDVAAPDDSLAAARHLQVDLGDALAVEAWLAKTAARPPYDLVVHNAGINATGPLERVPLPTQLEVLRVNLRAPIRLTQGLLAARRIATGGQLVFIASLSHFLGYPGASVYAATKDGLASYARSLAVGLARERIQVLSVFPGPVRTEHARRHAPERATESRRMAPEDLARRIERALLRRRRLLLPGGGARLAGLLGRILPGLSTRLMRRALYLPLERATRDHRPNPT